MMCSHYQRLFLRTVIRVTQLNVASLSRLFGLFAVLGILTVTVYFGNDNDDHDDDDYALVQVSVIAKRVSGDCAAAGGRHLTYFADEGRLPSAWNDDVADAATTTPRGAEIFETVPAELVEIHLHYAATVISLRLVGRYYSVSVRLPDSDRRNTSTELASIQLCHSGCPGTELVDLAAFFHQTARRQVKTKRTTGVRDRKAVLPLPVALWTCGEAAGLSGYLVDSCVFDLLNTGDLSFARLSAKGVLADVRGVGESTAVLNNASIGMIVAERLRAEVTVTSSAGPSLFSTARCRRRTFYSLFVVVVVSASLTMRFLYRLGI